MLVSIVLPCYNPPEHWGRTVAEQYALLRENINDPIELILVEDGPGANVDNEVSKLSAAIPAFKCIRYEVNHGKGYAIRKGVELASGDVIIYTDIDFPYTIESVLKIYTALKEHQCEIAVGIKGDDYYAHVPLARRVLSKGLRKMIRFFLSIPITDTQCGLKGFVKEIKPLFLQTTIDRYLFDLEFIRNSYRNKHTIKPIKIELREDVHFRVMNYRILIPEIMNFAQLLFRKERK